MESAEIVEVGNTLGEGVLWDVETQSLWWTDIHERRLCDCGWEHRVPWPGHDDEQDAAIGAHWQEADAKVGRPTSKVG